MNRLTKKGADKRLLKIIADYVRQRDNNTCYTCGKVSADPRKMNAGHLFSRRYTSIRYDLRNIHCQCVYCNKYLAGNLHEYIRRFKADYGEEAYEELYELKETRVKHNLEDLKILIKQYSENTENAVKKSKF